MNASRVLIKLGGAALDGSHSLEAARILIKSYRDLGYRVIVVHGGGPMINTELARRGIQWTFINGQRVTTPAMVDVIESVLCGSVNRRLVRYFGAHDLPVVGVSGTDQNTLLCKQASQELGRVGAIQKVNTAWIQTVLNSAGAPVPVIAPVGVGIDGECYNINADWVASSLAAALKVEQLLFLTDQPGILDEEGQVITNVDSIGLQNMIECKVVSGGMMAKAQAILNALSHGVDSARVSKAQLVDGRVELAAGTLCSLGLSRARGQKEEVHAAI